MKLHLDKDAFRVLIENIHRRTGFRTDVLEKDYYVVLILKELADKQSNGLPAYFKGGTALYKALKTTKRFSEDIDISVDTRNCSRTQNDKRLEAATKKYVAIQRDSGMGKTNRSEIISIYRYNPLTMYDANDALQRFGFLKIEATSFTISEPIESMNITPMIYELATMDEKYTLERQYDVKPFSIMTITIERIFIDKLFAAESYKRKSDDLHFAFDAAKHIYDLVVMKDHPKIIELLSDTKKMKSLLDIRMKEEYYRLDGISGVIPSAFTVFDSVENCINVRNAYEIMQKQYVLRPSDCIDFDIACQKLRQLKESLFNNLTWKYYGIEKSSLFQTNDCQKINHNYRREKIIENDYDDLER